MKLIKVILAAFMVLCGTAHGQEKALIKRVYKQGDTSRYRLVCTEYHNGNWRKTVISECRLTVVKGKKKSLYDEVRWLSRKEFTPRDTASDDDKAAAVKPYRISLQPGASLDLPPIEVPEMTQPMQDFNTFFVAVSPQLGTTELRQAGDSIVSKEVVIADLSNGSFIVKGQDGFIVKMKMTGVAEDSVTVLVDFLPPGESCFPYFLEEMNRPVVGDTPNNIQMVLRSAGEKYIVQYGIESFSIKAVTGRNDGRILNAYMNNLLTLQVKINCDKEYGNCQGQIPYTIKRELKLELLGN